MKISARNSIPGTIKNLKLGPVSAEVTINVASGIDIVAGDQHGVGRRAQAQGRSEGVRRDQGQQRDGGRRARLAFAERSVRRRHRGSYLARGGSRCVSHGAP